MPYQEIQALGFPNSPRKLGLYEEPWACIYWYGPCTQLVNSKYFSWTSVSLNIAIDRQKIEIHKQIIIRKDTVPR